MNERGRAFLDEMLTPDMTGVGTGWTMVESSRGVRTVAYGPPGLSTGMLSTGVLAALTVPNLLEAVDRAKQKRTTADMRSIGIAVESFAIDENRYPGPTDGWQPVDTIAALLEPAYIRELPREDGWGRALLFRSDGTSYRILSAGRDGELDRDWSGDIEPAVTTGADADIVWVDGLFVIRPARLADKLP